MQGANGSQGYGKGHNGGSDCSLLGRLPTAMEVCVAVSGLGDGVCSRLWFWLQIASWGYLAAAAAESLSRWAVLIGKHHRHSAIIVGTCKSLGFLAVDVAAIGGLIAARQAYRHRGGDGGSAAVPLGRATGFDAPAAAEAQEAKALRAKCGALVALSIVFAIVEAAHWALWLHEMRLRRLYHFRSYMLRALVGVCAVVSRPGLVCALLPALMGRAELGATMQELVKDVESGPRDWDLLLIAYGKAAEQADQLCSKLSPVVGALLLALGLSAINHGVAVWIWVDKLSSDPSTAITLHYVLAALHGLAFLLGYFGFTGIRATHGKLVGAIGKRLSSCPPEQVGKLIEAFHFLRAQNVCWRLHMWPGGALDLDELKGKYFSAAFLGNLIAKMVPKLGKADKATESRRGRGRPRPVEALRHALPAKIKGHGSSNKTKTETTSGAAQPDAMASASELGVAMATPVPPASELLRQVRQRAAGAAGSAPAPLPASRGHSVAVAEMAAGSAASAAMVALATLTPTVLWRKPRRAR